MSKSRTLKDFMTPEQREVMKNLPTSHANCQAKTRRYRPGKTARDRAAKKGGV